MTAGGRVSFNSSAGTILLFTGRRTDTQPTDNVNVLQAMNRFYTGGISVHADVTYADIIVTASCVWVVLQPHVHCDRITDGTRKLVYSLCGVLLIVADSCLFQPSPIRPGIFMSVGRW